jgi:mono/diheme cytochrome c family protein
MTGLFQPIAQVAFMPQLLRYRQFIWIALVIALATIVLDNHYAQAQQQQPTPPPYDPATVPTPVQPPITGSGKTLFQQNCAPCHGEQGNSDGPSASRLPKPPPKLSDPATSWGRSPAEYFHIIKYGRIQNFMPPWGQRLDDEQIWQMAYYAWSLHTDQTQVQQGADLYTQNCASCHGPTGAGDGPNAKPGLSDLRDAAKIGILTQADLSQAWQTAHADQGASWNEEQHRQVLDYLRTFSYVPPWESAFRPGDGLVRGQIVQGSAGGGPITSLPVTLTAYINFEPAKSFTATADSTGNFQFGGLSTDPAVVYIAQTTYVSLTYNSPLVQLSALTTTVAISLPVYETTTDGSAVHISRANWLIDTEPGALRMGMILFFSNPLDRTFIGNPVEGLQTPPTLALPLPPGATDIQFEDGSLGERYQQVGDRLFDTSPVWPGEGTRRLVYSYRLPFSGDSTEVAQSFLYPIADFNLLVAELPNLNVTVDQLTAQGEQTVQGLKFHLWHGQALSKPTLKVSLRGLPPAGSPDPRAVTETEATSSQPPDAVASTPPLKPIVPLSVGVVLLVVLAGIFYLPLRKQFTLDRVTTLTRTQAALVQDIAALDDQHANGQLPDANWGAARAPLKAKLLAVAQELAVIRPK